MSKSIKIKRGLNIRLKGEAERVLVTLPVRGTYAVKPTDFHGLVPRLAVKEGDTVKAGSLLFTDKYDDRVRYTSPVSGKVISINRGEKRRILDILIEAGDEIQYESFSMADPKSLNREQIIEKLLASGLWTFIRQRPFSTVANPSDLPKSIFVSCFDTSPLGPDYDFLIHGNGEEFQLGLDALAKLTNGKLHLNLSGTMGQSKVFTNAKGVQINTFNGPHPAGNVGVQIHHLDPINKGDIVWYANPQDILVIGRLFRTGKVDLTKSVAITGAALKAPKYVRCISGAQIKNLVEGNIRTEESYRIISGNVLTGEKVSEDNFLGFYHQQITVIEEGDKPLFFMTKGWAGPGFDRFSLSRTFPTFLMPSKKYDLTTNLNGEERAFVMTGQYEKVFPFDIYPVQLIKSVIVNDLDAMEKLGIYEVDPEDFALCEFVCTSKIESQQIIRDGLDLAKQECF